jgi:hypothetical protein
LIRDGFFCVFGGGVIILSILVIIQVLKLNFIIKKHSIS